MLFAAADAQHAAPQRTAVIDLGSNSARVVLMNGTPGYAFHLEDEIREIVRLREGMNEQGLSEDAVARGLLTLRMFKRFCESVQADHIIATATSAVREAANGPQFLERVEHEIGLQLRILDGDEEAYYGVIGALNAVDLSNGVIVDIGGGSAQVSQIRGRRFAQGQALTLGSLALTERFVKSDPIKKSDFQKVQAEIARQLDEVKWLKDERCPLVGLGGTIRNLARIEAARRKFPLDSINGMTLSRGAIDETITQLRDFPLAQRRRIPGLVRDRADIILPGALVIRNVLERLGQDALLISESGLREGLFFEQFWKALPYPVAPDLREFSVVNLARFYGYQEAHTGHVRHLATCLFDSLQLLHGYGAWERELLRASAILHDIGTAIRYNDHHKHSQTLIASSGLPGYTPREVAIIALLARFHRKGTPSVAQYAALLEPGDEARVTRLAALLRLAEYLERGRNGIVRDIKARWDKQTLWLTLTASEDPAVELWDAQRNALELVSAAYGRRAVLEAS